MCVVHIIVTLKKLFIIASYETTSKESPMKTSFSLDIVTIETEMQEQVDENHPIVKELISAGYTVERSLDAVDKYETLDAAMNYLDQQDLDEDEEKDLIPFRPGYNQQASNDDLLPSDDKIAW